MTITFFAARKQHLQYFSHLARQLTSEGLPSVVLWHKTLFFRTFWIRVLFTKTPFLEDIVQDHIREKQNTPPGRHRSAQYWLLLSHLKTLEARILYAAYFQYLKSARASALVIWNGLKFRQRIAIRAAADCSVLALVMENGLLPGMTTLDPRGVNFVNSVPRDPGFFRQFRDAEELSRPAVQAEKPEHMPERYIFVPFQVNTDSQIVLFSPWIADMYALVNVFLAAEQALGEDMPHIVMKTHPSCCENYAHLMSEIAYKSKRLHLIDDGDTQSLIANADAVITINSTVGLEALLHNKPTLVLGQAFYNLKGLTQSASSQQELETVLPSLPDNLPDEELRRGFLHYLKHSYQIPGRWKEASEDHCRLAAARIAEIVKHYG